MLKYAKQIRRLPTSATYDARTTKDLLRAYSWSFKCYQTDAALFRRYAHTPVLVTETVDVFRKSFNDQASFGDRNTKNPLVFIDMTFGSGGHTEAILKAFPTSRVYSLDRDRTVSVYASRLAVEYGRERIKHFHGKFTQLIALLSKSGEQTANIADAILFDVGVSSMQFDDHERGFGLSRSGPLDMRMDSEETGLTAADVVNKLEELDIYKILKKYGQEKKARQIARGIVEYRQMMGPLQSTGDLQNICASVYKDAKEDSPKDKLGRKRHPATLTFQALRIFVNDELNELYNGLKIAHRLLKAGGPCAVITFHSLEHNIVHQTFNAKDALIKESIVTNDLATNCDFWETTNQLIRPKDTEVKDNPRARSAELRIACKRG